MNETKRPLRWRIVRMLLRGLLLLIVILPVLAVIVVPDLMHSPDQAREAKARQDIAA